MGWHARAHRRGIDVDELRRLHRAELAVATAPTTYAAAKELAGHAIALLDAPAAVVLIEGVGDTVRVARGDAGASVYDPGSRMRLLDDDGVPVGSIAVAPRCADRPYDDRDERVLDALAQRVSATLHRVSLFDAVHAERAALADVLDSSSDGIWAVGADLRVQAWNPAMAAMTGVSADDARGEPCCAVFRPVAEDGASRFGNDCPCRQDHPTEELLKVLCPAGDRWLNCAFSPRPGGGMVVVARDVTARKRLDDEKADFLATVSHELRTPLTPLKGFLQSLTKGDDHLAETERQEVYAALLREEQRLERLVDQLLQATAADQPTPLERRPVDLAALVREAADRHGGAVEVVAARGMTIAGDVDACRTVFDNLLSNAAKYAAGTPVTVRLRAAGRWVVTGVEDGGPGIPAADRERVFDKFIRLGDHLTRSHQGVGLGLYIARRAAEAMGGSITCEASQAGGAAFVVRLPRLSRSSPRPARSVAPRPRASSR